MNETCDPSLHKTLIRVMRKSEHDTQFFCGFFPPRSEEEERSITIWSLTQSKISSFSVKNNFVKNSPLKMKFNLDEIIDNINSSLSIIDVSSESGEAFTVEPGDVPALDERVRVGGQVPMSCVPSWAQLQQHFSPPLRSPLVRRSH